MKVNAVRGRRRLYWLFRGAAVVLGVFMGAPLLAQDHWYAQIHVGRYSPESLENMLSHNWRLQNEYLASLGVGREFYRWRDRLGLEWEGQFAAHWGDSGSYGEFVAALNARWLKFPWNGTIMTTFAVGDGLSYTTQVPKHERRDHSRGSQRLLNYLMIEVTAARPRYRHWTLYFRLHHRSGVFGLFGGVHGASNYPSIGLRYSF